MKVCVFAGDGIGPEIMEQGLRLMDVLRRHGVALEIEAGLLGGCAVDATGEPYPQASQRLVEASDAVLLAAVGGPRYDSLPRHQRPEKGLLALRQHMGVFANLRPVKVFDALIESSSLKPELIKALDVLIVRELTGDVYFGEPRGISLKGQERVGINTMIYSESEVRRVAHVAFSLSRQRRAQVCSVDKMNVLESSQLWRETVVQVAKEYPDVTLTHLLVDNAAMQLVKKPAQFDVILTGNLFGDILSDEAAMLSGSIGLLPSASLGPDRRGLYEPIHGSAPDIQGQDKANPLGLFLSIAMMMRYSFQLESWAKRIETAIFQVLQDGLRTLDLALKKDAAIAGTREMGSAVIDKLEKGISL